MRYVALFAARGPDTVQGRDTELAKDAGLAPLQVYRGMSLLLRRSPLAAHRIASRCSVVRALEPHGTANGHSRLLRLTTLEVRFSAKAALDLG